MKNFTCVLMKRNFPVFVFLVVMIFLIKPAFSQDTVRKKDDYGKVKLMIKVDKDGKSKTIDTTFTITGPMDEKYLEDILKDYKDNMKDFADQMHDMEININAMGIPDSAMIDSLGKMGKKFEIIARSGHGREGYRGKEHSFRFDYDFDMPDLPDLPEPPPPPQVWGLGHEFGHGFFEDDQRNEAGSLSDILGDIPMDQVKSYSIKNTKDGKKIVIEVKNTPVFEHHDKVIIIHDNGKKPDNGHMGNRHREKKIIIRTGDSDDQPKDVRTM
jgi:hypothetical protein